MPSKDSPKNLSNFITMRILKNIRRRLDAFEKAQENNDVLSMIQNQLSDEDIRFLNAQSKLEDPDSLEEQTSTVLEDLDLKDLLKMYENFRPSSN